MELLGEWTGGLGEMVARAGRAGVAKSGVTIEEAKGLGQGG